ncbi:MAG TPA: T9SS type A sorting domain-containing protein [Bacteroidia bacterium]|nr:T9SS type A sorting domain-containing protein [Bacteroidia bacterium]HNT79552.1 T9SS type A sorting domain-containing protein [Bacteroidia bacterium]
MYKFICSALFLFFSSGNLSLAQTITGSFDAPRTHPSNYLGFNGGNVIYEGQVGLGDAQLVSDFTQLKPASLRYPAGNIGNYWDWKKGWFYSETDLPEQWKLPEDYGVITQRNNGFDQLLKHSLRQNISPIFNLNLLSSDVHYQLASLYSARGMNLPFDLVELGNEFYRDDPHFYKSFSTSIEYANVCNQMATLIKSLPKGGPVKIAACGATDIGKETALSRRNTWNKDVLLYLNQDIDAITLHHYIGTGLGQDPVTLSRLPDIFANPLKSISSYDDELNAIRNAGKEVWITEYNLIDRNHCLQGTWAHALFLSGMTLGFLESDDITKIICHTMSGDAAFGMMYSNTNGMNMNGFFNGGLSCYANMPASVTGALSASGNAMRMISMAMHESSTKQKINFNDAVSLSDGISSISAWKFIADNMEQAVIINYHSAAQTLKIKNTDWDLSGAKIEIISAGPGGVFDLTNGEAVTNPGNQQLKYSAPQNSTQQFTLPAYSIARIYKAKNGLRLTVLNDSICSGSVTALKAIGTAPFNWNGNGIIWVSDDGSVANFSNQSNFRDVYTVSVSDANGNHQTADITVFAVPTLDAIASKSKVCKGESLTLTAVMGSNSYNKSYIWIPSIGIINPTAEQTTATPDKTTTYYVYASDGKCWSAVDSVTVEVESVSDAGSDSLFCNTQLPFLLESKTAESNTSYRWYEGNTFLGYGSTMSVHPLTETTYSLITKNKNNAVCWDTSFVTLTPVTCCESTSDPLLTATHGMSMKTYLQQITPVLIAQGAQVSNGVIKNFSGEFVFNGTMVVDTSVTFEDCPKIYFGEKASLKVDGRKISLKFKRCTLRVSPCNYNMWKGIEVTRNNNTLVIDETYIKNAECAVDANEDATVSCINSFFEDNYESIKLHHYQDIAEFDCYGNQFSHSWLKPPYSGLKPASYVTVSLVPDPIIGNVSQAKNVFDNAICGIRSVSSSIQIVNNEFRNFSDYKSSDIEEGSAVLILNKMNADSDPHAREHLDYKCKVGGSSANEFNSFINCYRAVSARDVTIDVLNNQFTDCSRAIKLKGIVHKTINVISNTITNTDLGIDLLFCSGSSATISDNTISVNSFPDDIANRAKFGIRLSDDLRTSALNKIERNAITNRGTHGIWLLNSMPVSLNENSVSMLQNFSRYAYGIRSESNEALYVSCNTVAGQQGESLRKKIAFSFTSSPGLYVYCNNSDRTATGFEFMGDCNGTRFQSNSMRYHKTGLALGADRQVAGIFGPQPSLGENRTAGNFFIGQYTIASGSDAGKGYFSHSATWSVKSKSDGAQGSFNQFLVHSGDALQIPAVNKKTGSSATAFTPVQSGWPAKWCNTNCSKSLWQDNVYVDYVPHAEFIVADSDPSRMNDSYLNYTMKRRVLGSLMFTTSGFGNGSSILQNYLNSNQSSATSSMLRFNYDLVQSYNIENPYLSNPDWMDHYLDSLTANNDAISTSNVFEQNEKLVNELYLQTVSREIYSFNSSQQSQLWSICNQCPYVAGDAVFRARALYALVNDSMYFNDLTLCKNAGIINRFEAEASEAESFQIYPNPSSGMFTIALSEFIDAGNLSIAIYTMQGTLVKQIDVSLANREMKVDLLGMEPGIYFAALLQNQSIHSVQKLVVIH